MLIYEALKNDHDRLKELLLVLENTTERAESRRTSLLQKIRKELIPHSRSEEKIFYEQLKRISNIEVEALEGFEEHAIIDRLLAELENIDPSDKRWTAKFSVLKELLEHHIKDEEKSLFKEAKKVFNRQQAQSLGHEFMRAKREFMSTTRRPSPPPSHRTRRRQDAPSSTPTHP